MSKITLKEKFKKYYANIWNLLHEESSNENTYNFILFNKHYNINFEYSISHSSLFINNYEIYIYDRGADLDLKNNLKFNNIDGYKKHTNLTYEQLLLLFKKIKFLINAQVLKTKNNYSKTIEYLDG
jgi:hypothetical protein